VKERGGKRVNERHTERERERERERESVRRQLSILRDGFSEDTAACFDYWRAARKRDRGRKRVRERSRGRQQRETRGQRNANKILFWSVPKCICFKIYIPGIKSLHNSVHFKCIFVLFLPILLLRFVIQFNSVYLYSPFSQIRNVSLYNLYI